MRYAKKRPKAAHTRKAKSRRQLTAGKLRLYEVLHNLNQGFQQVLQLQQLEKLGLGVWSKNSCGAGIELGQSSEPLATLNRVAALFGFIGSIREKELVAFALMIAFAVIMRAELGRGPEQR